MKSVFKICVLGILLFSAGFANAQGPKFGHIDLQALYQIMPERSVGENQLLTFQKKIQADYESMGKEFEEKRLEFEAKKDSMTEAMRNVKIEELKSMQARMQSYEANAQQNIQEEQAKIFKPMLDKVDKAVKEVGVEKGLIYVFDMGSRVILYNSKESTDILPFVKTKLGIK